MDPDFGSKSAGNIVRVDHGRQSVARHTPVNSAWAAFVRGGIQHSTIDTDASRHAEVRSEPLWRWVMPNSSLSTTCYRRVSPRKNKGQPHFGTQTTPISVSSSATLGGRGRDQKLSSLPRPS